MGCLSRILLVVFGGGIVVSAIADQAKDRTATASHDSIANSVDANTRKDHAVIDLWLTHWSKSQAKEFRRLCKDDSACKARNADAARPKTSFGWNGSQEIRPTANWARGRRYWVTANNRSVLLYLEGDRVDGAYFEEDGMRTNLCRGSSCNK